MELDKANSAVGRMSFHNFISFMVYSIIFDATQSKDAGISLLLFNLWRNKGKKRPKVTHKKRSDSFFPYNLCPTRRKIKMATIIWEELKQDGIVLEHEKG